MGAAVLLGWLCIMASAFLVLLGLARSRWGVPLLLVPMLAETVVLALGLILIVVGLPVAGVALGLVP